MHLRIGQPCPTTLGDDDGVANSEGDLGQEMVPRHPAAGLICRYQQTPGTATSPPQFGVLYRRVRLGAQAATQLAAAADRVDTSPPPVRVYCPVALAGTATILVFGYTRSSVDLWYFDTGCQTLDNGVIGASETANPSFSAFMQLVDRLAPRP